SGDATQCTPKRKARLGQPVAIEQKTSCAFTYPRQLSPRNLKPKRRIANSAGNIDRVTHPCARAQQRLAARHDPKRRNRQCERTSCARRVAAHERDAIALLVFL